MKDIQKECEALLLQEGVDLNSEIDFDVNGKVHTLSFAYIIEVFMQASEESKKTFFTALQKALNAQDAGVDTFFEKMGQLLLMTHLSKKI